MPGKPKIRLVLFYILLCGLASCTVHAGGEGPIIHSIALNESTVPEEYRDLPLVAKCCAANEVLMRDEETGTSVCRQPNSTVEHFSPLFSEFNRTGIMVPGDNYSEFVAVVGDPCEYKRYMLDPEESEEDDNYLLRNGSVFAPHHIPTMLTPGKDYCMELIPEIGIRALVCFPKERLITTADSTVTIYACGLLISVPFLILTIVSYAITPKLRDCLGKALCFYCGCLAVAFSTLAFTQLASNHLQSHTCAVTAFLIQFSFVACFFWLNVMCIETWALVRYHVDRERRSRMHPKKLFFCYSLWAWSPPAILIIVSMAMDLSPAIPSTYVKPNFGKESCWFRSDAAAMAYFYVPLGLLLIINVVLFILTAVKLTRYQQALALRRLARNEESDRQDQRLVRRLKRTFLVCSILFFLMGLNWTMEVISWLAGGNPLTWSAFDLVNALQGVLVFGLFVLRRPPRDFVWDQIQRLRGKHNIDPEFANDWNPQSPMHRVFNGDMTPHHTVIF